MGCTYPLLGKLNFLLLITKDVLAIALHVFILLFSLLLLVSFSQFEFSVMYSCSIMCYLICGLLNDNVLLFQS